MVSKFIKKIVFLFFVLCLSIVFNITIQNSAEAKCARHDNGGILTDSIDFSSSDTHAFALLGTTDHDQDACQEEPLFYRLKFYKLALCTSNPYNNGVGTNGVAPDISSCTDIFNSPEGKLTTIEPNQSTELMGGFQIATGTYTHAYSVVSNHIDVKHYERYVLSNGNAATIFGYAATGDQSGTYCWTNTATTTYNNEINRMLHNRGLPQADLDATSSTNTMVCGASAPTEATSNYNFATEIIDHLGDGRVSDDPDDFRNFMNYETMSGIDGQAAINLLQHDETLATTIENGAKLGHFQTISPAITVDLNTVGLNLKFNTSESISIDSTGNSSDEIHAIKVGADPFGINYSVISGGF
ncbi:hypothetical protein OAI69_00495 [bacterium]|nr:hypothetical protein [bacterium]